MRYRELYYHLLHVSNKFCSLQCSLYNLFAKFFLSRSNFEHRRAKSSFHISACKEKMAMRKLYLKRRKIYHVRLMYTLYIYLLPFPDNLLINQFPDMVRTII